MAATGYTTGDPNKVNRSGDTMSGELVLPDSSPDSALTASSRGYVDNTATALSAAAQADFVNTAGDTMTGPLALTSGTFDVSDVQEALGTVLSTGVISGGEINVNGSNPAAVDISAVVGYIVDATTDPTNRTITRVTTTNKTVALSGASLTRVITWWMMDANGNVSQQGTTPTASERRTSLMLGATSYDTVSGAIFTDQTLPVILAQPANQFVDLLNALGPFKIAGLMATANGTNLSINTSAGTMFARAFEHYNGPTLTNNPHVITIGANTVAQFRRVLRAPGVSTPPLVTTLDVANYDLNGVLTAVGGGAGSSTVKRVWMFGTNDDEAEIAMQYGQSVYSTLDAAIAAIGSGSFVPNPAVFGNAALIGYIATTRTATDLSNTTQARFITPGRFPTP